MEYAAIDVLHALDLGVTQDVLGALFWESLGVVAKGRSRELQTKSLRAMLKEFYKEYATKCRVDALSQEMICKKKAKSRSLELKLAKREAWCPLGSCSLSSFMNKCRHRILRVSWIA